MPKVLLLSRQPLTARPLQDWLEHAGDDVVLFTTAKAVDGAAGVLAEHFPLHRLVPDYHGWSTETAAAAAGHEHRVDLVASTSESDVLRAARLRARLGLPGQSVESATAYRDKVVMKRLARAAGIRVPAFAPVDGPLDLLEFIDTEGLPVVVKPRCGSAAEGVVILRTMTDVRRFLDQPSVAGTPQLPGQWMAESFVQGDFFHMDGIMQAGRVVHAWPSQYIGGLAERIVDQTVLGSVLLAPDDERLPTLMTAAADVIAALPAAPFPLAFHLELWIGADGVPVLCEIASRAGGGPIAEAYERAFGVQLAREGLRAQCGSALVLDHQPSAPAVAIGWALVPPGHGEFSPPAESCVLPGVTVRLHLDPGARRRGVEHVADAAATIFVEAATAADVRRILDDAVRWWHTNTSWR